MWQVYPTAAVPVVKGNNPQSAKGVYLQAKLRMLVVPVLGSINQRGFWLYNFWCTVPLFPLVKELEIRERESRCDYEQEPTIPPVCLHSKSLM